MRLTILIFAAIPVFGGAMEPQQTIEGISRSRIIEVRAMNNTMKICVNACHIHSFLSIGIEREDNDSLFSISSPDCYGPEHILPKILCCKKVREKIYHFSSGISPQVLECLAYINDTNLEALTTLFRDFGCFNQELALSIFISTLKTIKDDDISFDIIEQSMKNIMNDYSQMLEYTNKLMCFMKKTSLRNDLLNSTESLFDKDPLTETEIDKFMAGYRYYIEHKNQSEYTIYCCSKIIKGQAHSRFRYYCYKLGKFANRFIEVIVVCWTMAVVCLFFINIYIAGFSMLLGIMLILLYIRV